MAESKLAKQNQGDMTFAVKLHALFHDAQWGPEIESIIRFQPHGRCFRVHDREAFVQKVLPYWFNMKSFASFQRQLNFYGFKRMSSPGPDKGSYYHPRFLRQREDLAREIQRTPRKNQGPRRPGGEDPDFYAMPAVPVVGSHESGGGATEYRLFLVCGEDTYSDEVTLTLQTDISASCCGDDQHHMPQGEHEGEAVFNSDVNFPLQERGLHLCQDTAPIVGIGSQIEGNYDEESVHTIDLDFLF